MSTLAEQVVAQLKTDFDNVYDAGYQKGKTDGGQEILFTNHGTMYQKNLVITSDGQDGFYQYAYRYADKMETVYAPLLQALWTATAYIFQGCTALKSANFPRINRIGGHFFGGCTALTDVTLGSDDYPMVIINSLAFYGCTALESLSITGMIDGSLELQYSTKLSRDSIANVMNILSSDVTDKTLTLSLEAVNNAFETAEGLADGSISEEWSNLIATKPNWTISLV